ncbi:type II toxin-antitoxin system RelE/ParE family toxin [Mesorhizobium sp. KR2-14]|uniref:type II toxin-antitoxin system RelE/ParE family toxin n=1 Tax=Mesorhizobium sp. KR2-14 TaxID=3156610 RepID=UPI0032B52D28
MALEIVFARQAQRDLQDLLSFIAVDDAAAAQRMARRMEKTVLLLAERPYIGPLASGLGDAELRKMSLPPYIIFYRLKGDRLQIARILHSARDIDTPTFFSG